jgi:hypothetical protein
MIQKLKSLFTSAKDYAVVLRNPFKVSYMEQQVLVEFFKAKSSLYTVSVPRCDDNMEYYQRLNKERVIYLIEANHDTLTYQLNPDYFDLQLTLEAQ